MSFFTESSEAQRYAQSRPYFHPLAIARAKKAAGIERTVPIALDVACGTGQSAAALTSIAELVIGIDVSWNMLANADRTERVRYVRARAESMPFPSESIQVITTALAFHWFDRHQFLGEACRVLILEGLLLVYTNGFSGIMREDPAFQKWARGDYPERFPTPPRDSKPLTPVEAAGAGFLFIGEERYENEVTSTPEELVAYLATQTNVSAAVQQGPESLESASRWLLEQVQPFFASEKATFVFVSRAWYLRKQAVR
ncbi:MAG: class I SAM-dependent methyltransferase [Chloroflexota bacterium]|nr:MAG: class I SAM-dependent methyltransferase [Chloroflexota bacterium]